MMLISRIGIFVFALVAFVFAVFSSDQLVLLARTSFTGTSMMAPMIFVAIFYDGAEKMTWLPFLTLLGLILFISASFGWLSPVFWGIRFELLLLITLSLAAITGVLLTQKNQ